MSSTTRPISPSRFRLAIHDLPISNLHTKAAELRNSIAHLDSSNAQLKGFADAGDSDCAEAIRENEEVITRMQERIQMLKEEVEGRGMRWVEDMNGEWEGKPRTNGVGALEPGEEAVNGESDGPGSAGTRAAPNQSSGRLTDDDLRRMLAARMGEPSDGEVDDDEGVHL